MANTEDGFDLNSQPVLLFYGRSVRSLSINSIDINGVDVMQSTTVRESSYTRRTALKWRTMLPK